MSAPTITAPAAEHLARSPDIASPLVSTLASLGERRSPRRVEAPIG